MIAYRHVPGDVGPRPLLDVFFSTDLSAPHLGLVDSGAVGIRFGVQHARWAGIELPVEPNGPDVIAGQVRSQTYTIRRPLWTALGRQMVYWQAHVTFCDPWPHPFALLGQRGFFDAFDVFFEGRDRQFRCIPRGDSPA